MPLFLESRGSGILMTQKKPPRVEVSVGACDIVVSIRGLPHLVLRRSEIIGWQSYYRDSGVAKGAIYYIEFTTTTRDLITSNYDDRSLWEEILRALAESRMFYRVISEQPVGGERNQ
jgi:hypothetical protein